MSKVRCWAVSSHMYFSGIAWSLCVRWSNGTGQATNAENSSGSVGSINPSQAGSLGSKLQKHHYMRIDIFLYISWNSIRFLSIIKRWKVKYTLYWVPACIYCQIFDRHIPWFLVWYGDGKDPRTVDWEIL